MKEKPPDGGESRQRRTGRRQRIRVPAGTPSILLAALVLAAATVLSGCGDGGPTAPGLETITLPVRVHLLASKITTLDAEFSPAQARDLVARTNDIWAQAGIQWRVDSILSDSMTHQADSIFTAVTLSGGTIPQDLFERMVPDDRIPGGGFDIFVLHDLAIFGIQGIYQPQIPAVFGSETTGVYGWGNQDILAHELGHALGLRHVPCTPDGDLMVPGSCDRGTDPTHLTATQIDDARAQAEQGVPYTGSFAPDSVSSVRGASGVP